MPKKLPPFVSRERSRHGKIVYYFRRDRGPRTRLPDLYDEKFDETYMAVLSGTHAQPKTAKPGPETLAWLVQQYRQASAYQSLSAATKKQRDNILKSVVDASGAVPFRAVTRKAIVDGRERRMDTPFQARHFLDAMRGLFRWAVDADLIEDDPTAGVKNPKRPQTDGFEAWTDEDVQKYQSRWPIGTKERVWLDVLLYTGLRRGDAVTIGKQHVRDGIATIRTAKTGAEVTIPIFDVLQATLDAGPVGDLHFIVGASGKPLTKEGFGNQFREACNAAGISKSAHGLRKIAATRAAEAGATVAQLEAMFGWHGGNMASLYTRSANRRRLALEGWGQKENAVRPHLAARRPHLK